jgi:hypothetical protein
MRFCRNHGARSVRPDEQWRASDRAVGMHLHQDRVPGGLCPSARAACPDRRYPPYMLIKARLKGHEFDLITLAELFSEGEPAVAADAEGYYLTFSAPEALFQQAGQLYDAASVMLRRINAVGRVLTDEFRPVGLTGRFHDEAGQHQVVLADSAEARGRAFAATVAVADGHMPPPPPPAPGPGYVQLAETHPDVAEVMDTLGKADPAPEWFELFKVFEIINDNAGGCVKRGWLSRNQASVFKASANREEVSGELARHARYKGDAPVNTMTLPEARQLISGLVTRWLDSLRSSVPGPDSR